MNTPFTPVALGPEIEEILRHQKSLSRLDQAVQAAAPEGLVPSSVPPLPQGQDPEANVTFFLDALQKSRNGLASIDTCREKVRRLRERLDQQLNANLREAERLAREQAESERLLREILAQQAAEAERLARIAEEQARRKAREAAAARRRKLTVTCAVVCLLAAIAFGAWYSQRPASLSVEDLRPEIDRLLAGQDLVPQGTPSIVYHGRNGGIGRFELTGEAKPSRPRYVSVPAKARLVRDFGLRAGTADALQTLTAGAAGAQLLERVGGEANGLDLDRVLLVEPVVPREAPVRYVVKASVSRSGFTDLPPRCEVFVPSYGQAAQPLDSFKAEKRYDLSNAAEVEALRALVAGQEQFRVRLEKAREERLSEQREMLRKRQGEILAQFSEGRALVGGLRSAALPAEIPLLLEISKSDGRFHFSALCRNDGGGSVARRLEGELVIDVDKASCLVRLSSTSGSVCNEAGPLLGAAEALSIPLLLEAGVYAGNFTLGGVPAVMSLQPATPDQVAEFKAQAEAWRLELSRSLPPGRIYTLEVTDQRSRQVSQLLFSTVDTPVQKSILQGRLYAPDLSGGSRLVQADLCENKYQARNQVLVLTPERFDKDPQDKSQQSLIARLSSRIWFTRQADSFVASENGLDFVLREAAPEVVAEQRRLFANVDKLRNFVGMPGQALTGYATSDDGQRLVVRLRVFDGLHSGRFRARLEAAGFPMTFRFFNAELLGLRGAIQGRLIGGAQRRELKVPFIARDRVTNLNFELEGDKLVGKDDYNTIYEFSLDTVREGLPPSDAVVPSRRGLYYWYDGDWRPFPQGTGRVTQNAGQVFNDWIALSPKQKLGTMVFSGTPEVPVFHKSDPVGILHVGPVFHHSIKGYPVMEAAELTPQPDGTRSAFLYRIDATHMGFTQNRESGFLDELNSGARYLWMPERRNGRFAVLVGADKMANAMIAEFICAD